MRLLRTLALIALIPLSPGCRNDSAPAAESAAEVRVAPVVDAATRALPLVPWPASIDAGEGRFALDAEVVFEADGKPARAALDRFTGLLATLDAPMIAGQGTSDRRLRFEHRPEQSGGEEGYRIEVTENAVRVTAPSAAGLHHGATTLWQLVQQDEDGIGLPVVLIEDSPRFGWRGLMLDSARHMQSVEEIKHLLDAMALHKLNVFHWHLTDDQGWRIEIRKYPRLAEVGGCRVPAGEAGMDPASGGVRAYCGYYTQEQIREVVAYAAARHISVVPEIDMPGHAQAAVAAYPELGVTGEAPPVSNEWGVHTWLFNVEESTLGFLEDVLDEVVALFPGEFIHIGGDEAVKDQWKASAQVQARMRELGLADEEALQSWFIQRMERHLAGHGRRLIGWDEILEGGLAPNATVMSWRGTEGGLEAASMGHDVVMSPGSHLYFDFLQTRSPSEPPGRTRTLPLQQVYAFEPIPEALAPERHHHVLGVQANVWTEHIRTYVRVQHAVFPRMAALAEVGWTPAASRDLDAFLARMPALLDQYARLDIVPARTPFEVLAQVTGSHVETSADVRLEVPLGIGDIHYTLDGSEPSIDSPRFERTLEVPLPTDLSAVAFHRGRPLSAPMRQRIDVASMRVKAHDALSHQTSRLELRLEDDGPVDGERAVFTVDLFAPAWKWHNATLWDASAVRVRAGRIPYNFQLWRDEASRRFVPAETAHGELLLEEGCDGRTVGRVPLPAEPDSDGFLTLDVPLEPVLRRADLCIRFTGDNRPWTWVLDRVELRP